MKSAKENGKTREEGSRTNVTFGLLRQTEMTRGRKISMGLEREDRISFTYTNTRQDQAQASSPFQEDERPFEGSLGCNAARDRREEVS